MARPVIHLKATGTGTWTPYAIRAHQQVLLRYSQEFLAAATKTGSLLVRAYLMGHAIEIFLKVLLLRDGMTTRTLKKDYGHDLSALLSECQRRGLKETAGVSVELAADLRAFNNVYASKALEYFSILHIVAPPRLPDLRRIQRFAKGLEARLKK